MKESTLTLIQTLINATGAKFENEEMALEIINNHILKIKEVESKEQSIDFKFENLPKLYENCRIKDSKQMGCDKVCYFSDGASDYLELYVLLPEITRNRTHFSYLHDNFPGQRRYFENNTPVLTLDEFESDLKRMRIPIPKRI